MFILINFVLEGIFVFTLNHYVNAADNLAGFLILCALLILTNFFSYGEGMYNGLKSLLEDIKGKK